jgi:hypothetical protein
MESLIKTLPAILKAAGDADEVVEAACIVAWKKLAGETLSANAVPLRLEDHKLVIAVADSAWQKQMKALSSQLLSNLNAMLGKPLVKFLEFREEPHTLARERRAQVPVNNAALTTIPTELISAASEIHDPDLRRAFLGAATSCLQRLEKPES